MADTDAICEELQETIDAKAGDSAKLSQAESVEVYRSLATHCDEWARLIESEMT